MPRHFFNYMYPDEAQKIHDEYATFIPNVYRIVRDLFVFTPKTINDKSINNTEAVSPGIKDNNSL